MTKPRRPFQLMVDSGSRDEPPDRYFGTLATARAAGAGYAEHFQPFIWIIEWTGGGPATAIVHVKNGKDQ